MEWKTVQIPNWLSRVVPTRRPGRTRVMRHYTAAAVNRLTSSWGTVPVSADEAIASGLKSMRTRSREQYRNNDYARRFVDLVVENVIGSTGIALQARVMRAGQPDEFANDVLEKNWRRWGMRGNCEVTGKYTWHGLQEIVAKTWAVDGEFLARKVRRGPFDFQLQVIDPELLDVDHTDEVKNGYIRMGIEFDEWDAPVAYHIIKAKSARGHYYGGQEYIRVPEDEMIHVFRPDLVCQSRGVPRMATALARMQMLAGYEEAALVNARNGASNMGFFESEDGTEYVGDGQYANGETMEEVEPGTMRVLPPGVRFSSYDPDYPNGEFGEFVKAQLRGIAVGLGVDYAGLSGDLEGVNYSSIRAGVIESREMWKGLQRMFIDQFCGPVYRAWLRQGLISQSIVTDMGAPLSILNEERYQDVYWQGKRWAWVDPLKDMQASVLAIESNLTSPSRIIKEQGGDPEEVWAEIKKDQEQMSALGLVTAPSDEDVGYDDEND